MIDYESMVKALRLSRLKRIFDKKLQWLLEVLFQLPFKTSRRAIFVGMQL